MDERYKQAMDRYAAAARARRERAEHEGVKAETAEDLKFGESANQYAGYGTAIAPGIGTGIGAIVGGVIGLGKAYGARKKRGQSTWEAVKGIAGDAGNPFDKHFWERALPSGSSAGPVIGALAQRGWGGSGGGGEVAKAGAESMQKSGYSPDKQKRIDQLARIRALHGDKAKLEAYEKQFDEYPTPSQLRGLR